MAPILRILIVEDNLPAAEMLCAVLANAGHSVVISKSSAEARTAFSTGPFDLVFLDLHLPDCHGLVTLEYFRRINPKVPVAILTGNSSLESAIQAMRLGAFDYLRKPVEHNEVLGVVNRIRFSNYGEHEIAPSVFLSHNHADKPFVRRLANDLQGSGIFAWVDEFELKLGDSLIEKLSAAIDRVDYLAVILSNASINSKWVKIEVQKAMNFEISKGVVKVLPILREKVELPWFLDGKLYADFTDDANYTKSFAFLLDRFKS